MSVLKVEDVFTLGSPGVIKVPGSFPKPDYKNWVGHKISAYIHSYESSNDVFVQLNWLDLDSKLEKVGEYTKSLPPSEDLETPAQHLILSPRKLIFKGSTAELTLTNVCKKRISFKLKKPLSTNFVVKPTNTGVLEPFSKQKLKVESEDPKNPTESKFLIEAIFTPDDYSPEKGHADLFENSCYTKAEVYLPCSFESTTFNADENKENLPALKIVEEKPLLGHPCLARCSNGIWCRARLLDKASKTHVRVFCVDYGTEDNVPFENIWTCPPDLLNYCEGISCCSLAGFYTATKEEDVLLKECLNGKEVVAQIENLSCPIKGKNKVILSIFDLYGVPLTTTIKNKLHDRQSEFKTECEVKSKEVKGSSEEDAITATTTTKLPLSTLKPVTLNQKFSEQVYDNLSSYKTTTEVLLETDQVDHKLGQNVLNSITGDEIQKHEKQFSEMIAFLRSNIHEKEQEILQLSQQLQEQEEEFNLRLEDVCKEKESLLEAKMEGLKKNMQKELQLEKKIWQIQLEEKGLDRQMADVESKSIKKEYEDRIQKLVREKDQSLQLQQECLAQHQIEVKAMREKYEEGMKNLETELTQKYQEKIQSITEDVIKAHEEMKLLEKTLQQQQEQVKLLEQQQQEQRKQKSENANVLPSCAADPESSESIKILEERVAERTQALSQLADLSKRLVSFYQCELEGKTGTTDEVKDSK